MTLLTTSLRTMLAGRITSARSVVLQLKTPYRDGTTHVVMAPLEFLQRLALTIHGFSWRDGQMCARSGRTQGGATEAYSQYVDERRANTARDGAQLAVVVENPMNNPGQPPWSCVLASISFASARAFRRSGFQLSVLG